MRQTTVRRLFGRAAAPAAMLAAALTVLAPIAPAAANPAARTTRLAPKYATPKPAPAPAVQDSSRLDPVRTGILDDLYKQLESGAPFTAEEAVILREYARGARLTEIEADVLISRALYDHSVGRRLADEQKKLVDGYTELAIGMESRRNLAKERLALDRLNERGPATADAVLAPPANDTCAGAIAIPAAGPFPFCATPVDITEATPTTNPPAGSQPPAPSCQSNVSRDIFYTFTPSTTQIYRFHTCNSLGSASTTPDTIIAVYTSTGGCAGPFTEVPTAGSTDGCDDDSCGTQSLQSILTTQLTAGTTYYVVVYQFGTTAPAAGQTSVQLCVQTATAPANDTCAAATPLTLNIPANGTTFGATNDYQLAAASPCFTGTGQTATTATGADVVYSFTAAAAGNYSFQVRPTGSDSANPVLYLASACPAATPGTPVTVACTLAANRTGTSSTGEFISCVPLTAGQQVFVFVDSAVVNAGDPFSLVVTSCAAAETEPNNTPATANAFTCGVTGTNNPATDADFYSLGTPAAGSRVFAFVDASGANANDFDLRVNTATDTLEYDDANADVPFGSLAPSIAGTPLTAVPTYLQVDYFGATPTTIAEPYRLYAVVQPPSASATPETEPNNTPATANSATNNYFSGTLTGPSPSTDVDYYVTQAAAGDLLFVSLDTDPTRDNTPFNGALSLLDAAGNTLVAVNDGGSTSSTTSGAGNLTATTPTAPSEGLVYRVPTAGNYTVCVMAGSTSATTAAGDYLLSISRNCAAGGGGIGTDVGVTKSGPGSASPGGNITYTVTVTNTGSTATNVTLTDAIPANTTFVSNSGAAGFTCTNPAVGGTGTISCTAATLAPGTSVFTVVVAVGGGVTAGTVITNTANVTAANDTTGGNNSGTATATVGSASADLSITKTDSPDPVVTGSNITYTITVNNAGPSAATNVVVTDTLPAGVTYVSTGGTGTAGGTGNNRTITFASIPASGSATATIVATANCSLANGATITNTASVAATETDPNPANNTSAAAVTAVTNPAPTITCPANRTVTGNTPTGATGVTFSPTVNDNCPGATVTCTPASGSFFPNGTTTVTCTATDTGGATSAACTFTVTVVRPTFDLCAVADENNTLDYFRANSTTGYWEYTERGSCKVFFGFAETITRTSFFITLKDEDNPSYRMIASFNLRTGLARVTVTEFATNSVRTITDYNFTNSTCPPPGFNCDTDAKP